MSRPHRREQRLNWVGFSRYYIGDVPLNPISELRTMMITTRNDRKWSVVFPFPPIPMLFPHAISIFVKFPQNSHFYGEQATISLRSIVAWPPAVSHASCRPLSLCPQPVCAGRPYAPAACACRPTLARPSTQATPVARFTDGLLYRVAQKWHNCFCMR